MIVPVVLQDVSDVAGCAHCSVLFLPALKSAQISDAYVKDAPEAPLAVHSPGL